MARVVHWGGGGVLAPYLPEGTYSNWLFCFQKVTANTHLFKTLSCICGLVAWANTDLIKWCETRCWGHDGDLFWFVYMKQLKSLTKQDPTSLDNTFQTVSAGYHHYHWKPLWGLLVIAIENIAIITPILSILCSLNSIILYLVYLCKLLEIKGEHLMICVNYSKFS